MSVIRSFFLLAILLLAACSSEPEQPPVAPASGGKPALWVVTSNDSKGGTAWLFGTIHQLPPDTDWQGRVIDEAIRASDGLVIEVAGLDDTQAVSNVFADMGIRHGMPRLADRVSPALRTELSKAVAAASLPRHVLDNMETWAAALTLSSSMSVGLSLSQSAGVERVLEVRYSAEQKPVRSLETVEQQFGYFDGLPEAEQRAMLSAIIDDAEIRKDKYQKMLGAWISGDIESLLEDAEQGILASPLLRKKLVDDRNRAWAEAIAVMIDNKQRPFVAVGAGHLIGKTGVPELLAARGYTVKRIQ